MFVNPFLLRAGVISMQSWARFMLSCFQGSQRIHVLPFTFPSDPLSWFIHLFIIDGLSDSWLAWHKCHIMRVDSGWVFAGFPPVNPEPVEVRDKVFKGFTGQVLSPAAAAGTGHLRTRSITIIHTHPRPHARLLSWNPETLRAGAATSRGAAPGRPCSDGGSCGKETGA